MTNLAPFSWLLLNFRAGKCGRIRETLLTSISSFSRKSPCFPSPYYLIFLTAP